MEYQVWDIDAGSYLDRFTDEREALLFVKSLVDHFGDDYAESLSVGRVDYDGRVLQPLSGNELLAWVSQTIYAQVRIGETQSVGFSLDATTSAPYDGTQIADKRSHQGATAHPMFASISA